MSYRDPRAYWNERAKLSGVNAPGQAGTAVYDPNVIKTFKKIGHFYNILDFGCGTGRLYAELCKHCSEYTGVDFSIEMLELFKQTKKMRLSDLVLLSDLTGKLAEIPNEYFDAVVCNMVLQHIVDLKLLMAAVANIKRLIKKGGALYVHECMIRPEGQPRYTHIQLRPIYQYQALFKPTFDLQIGKSYMPNHTLLFGKKLG